MIEVERIEVDVAKQGHITNCYLIYDENKEAVLIDPGFEADKIIQCIKKIGVNVKYIVITHAHGDHIGALEKLQNYTKAIIMVHKNDYPALMSQVENYCELLNVPKQTLIEKNIFQLEEETIILNQIQLDVIHTPGHTSGCICLYDKIGNRLFTGDTIFSDCYGRYDLYSGNFEDMVSSIKKIFTNFQNVMIYPGHGNIVNIEEAKRYIKMLLSIKGIHL